MTRWPHVTRAVKADTGESQAPCFCSIPTRRPPAVGRLRARAPETALVEAATGPRASLSPTGDSEPCFSNDARGLPDVTSGASLSAETLLS